MCINRWDFQYPSSPAVKPTSMFSLLLTKHISYYILITNVYNFHILKTSSEILVNNVSTMALCRKFFDLICLWTCFVAVLAVEPHPQIKGSLPGLYNNISIVDNLLIDAKIKTSLYISLLFTRFVSVY